MSKESEFYINIYRHLWGTIQFNDTDLIIADGILMSLGCFISESQKRSDLKAVKNAKTVFVVSNLVYYEGSEIYSVHSTSSGAEQSIPVEERESMERKEYKDSDTGMRTITFISKRQSYAWEIKELEVKYEV